MNKRRSKGNNINNGIKEDNDNDNIKLISKEKKDKKEVTINMEQIKQKKQSKKKKKNKKRKRENNNSIKEKEKEKKQIPDKKYKIGEENKSNNNNNNIFIEKTIYECNNKLREIDEQLISVIKGQNRVMKKISEELFYFSKTTLEKWKNETSCEKLILPFIFSGISGSGKTMAVRKIKKLFNLEGTDYIYDDLTKYKDELGSSQFLGAPPGLAGFESKDSMPFKLLEAIGTPHKGPIEPFYDNNTKPKPIKPSITIEKIPPPVIMLHLDEFDKAEPSLLTLLMNFLENGILTSANGVKFELPDDIRLIVIFTANYGADYMIGLNSDDHFEEAIKIIRQDMKDHGIGTPQIGRIYGNIYPFFKLDKDELSLIESDKLKKNLDNINNDVVTKIEYSDDIINTLKETTISKYDPEVGIRGVNSEIQKFTHNLVGQIYRYTQECLPDIKFPLEPNPSLKKVHYNNNQFPLLKELMIKTPVSFPDVVTRSINQAIERNDESIHMLYLNYFHKGVEHILSSVISQDSHNGNINVVNNNIINNNTNHNHIIINKNNFNGNINNNYIEGNLITNIEFNDNKDLSSSSSSSSIINNNNIITTTNNIKEETTRICSECTRDLDIKKFERIYKKKEKCYNYFKNDKCNSCRSKLSRSKCKIEL